MNYKIHSNSSITRLSDGSSIPSDPANSDYQRFVQDVAEQGISIVEGPDVVEPSYIELRQAAYPPLQEQQDMQYWDSVNGTTAWQDLITAIKEQYPKTITGGTTVGPVPGWVQEAADNWMFNKQLREYAAAVERLSHYVLSEGRPEITEEVVVGEEPVLDADGLPVFDEEGDPVTTPITQTIVVQAAIAPLPESIEVVTGFDPETGEAITETVRNPEIVKDEEERAGAQSIVDATPQEVIDAYDSVADAAPAEQV
jgi:hypothetical protein